MGKVDKKLDAVKESDRAGQIYNRVMSNTFHVAIQKGRIVGRMEREGKTVEEIAHVISVPVESVKKMLDEDPEQFITQWHNEVKEENKNEKNTDVV